MRIPNGGNPTINCAVAWCLLCFVSKASLKRPLRIHAATIEAVVRRVLRPNGLDVLCEARNGAGLFRRQALGDFHVNLTRLRLL